MDVRKLEIQAYYHVYRVFRAKGELTWSRQKLLDELREELNIGNKAHKLIVEQCIKDESLESRTQSASKLDRGDEGRSAKRTKSAPRDKLAASSVGRPGTYKDAFLTPDQYDDDDDSVKAAAKKKGRKPKAGNTKPPPSAKKTRENGGVSDVHPSFSTNAMTAAPDKYLAGESTELSAAHRQEMPSPQESEELDSNEPGNIISVFEDDNIEAKQRRMLELQQKLGDPDLDPAEIDQIKRELAARKKEILAALDAVDASDDDDEESEGPKGEKCVVIME